MSTPRFELFSFWRTSATYRVRVALNLKGIVAEEHNIDIDAGENRGEDFLRINPMGAIPALIDREGDKTPTHAIARHPRILWTRSRRSRRFCRPIRTGVRGCVRWPAFLPPTRTLSSRRA